MSLIHNELSKHLRGRILWLLLVLLLLLNVVFCLRDGADYLPAERMKSIEALKVAEKIERENPDEIRQSYETMLAVQTAYEEACNAWFEQKLSGTAEDAEEPEPPEFPSTYYEGWDDFSLFDNYYRNVLDADEYQTLITEKQLIAEKTLSNYRKAGYSEDSYSFRYQVDFWIQYGSALESVHPNGTASYGWDVYWQYDGTGLFLLLASIFVGSRLFTVERDSGMDLVLRTCKRGRGRLALSKVGAATVEMLALSLVFHLSSLLTAAYQCGLSSPFAPIQQTADMVYCPYPLSQLGAFVLTVLFSALTALAICLLTAGLTILLKRALPSIIISAIVTGTEFFLAEGESEFLAWINLLTATSGNSLWARWSPIHVGDTPVSILPILTVTLFGIALLAALVCIERWMHSGMGTRLWNNPLQNLIGKVRFPRWMPRFRSVRLLPYEWQKLRSLRMGLICLLLVALQIGLSLNTLDGKPTFYDEMKARYMEEYSELSLADAEAAISERLAVYAEVTAQGKSTEMARLRVAGKITYEEYAAYCDLLNEALTHKETLSAYRNELVYLIEKGEELSIETYPVIATGFVNWMERDFDLPMVLLLFLLLAGIFAREHETKFYPLLQTTVKGRSSVWHTKIRFALICAMTAFLLSFVPNLVLLLTRYPTDYLTAPLVCVTRYQATAVALTAERYLLVIGILRMIGMLIWGLAVTALSELLRSEWLTAGCSLLLFLPYGLTLLGVTDAKWVDFTLLLSGDRLWLLSTESSGLTFLVIFTIAVTILCAGLVTASHRKFCK